MATDPPIPIEPDDDIVEYVSARARRGRKRPALQLNLTPMIDVTFLLLVYFMVATQFKLGEEVYRLDLPDRAPAAQAADPFDLDDEPLRVRVTTTGPVPGAYALRVQGPYDQPDSFIELHAFLRERRIGDGSGGGLFLPDHPIVIEPTRTTRWQHVVQTFDAVARARFTNVTIGKAGGT